MADDGDLGVALDNMRISTSEDVNISCETEITTSHQDKEEQPEMKLHSFPLPLFHLQTSSLPSAQPPSDEVYLQAAAIFQQLQTEKPVKNQLLHYGKNTESPPLGNEDKPGEEEAYQLAFLTLKYQDLLENMIEDSCFHSTQHISSDLLPLAMVMLFDFQERKFVLHSKKGQQDGVQEVRELEKSLQMCKTKLAASLARCRVKLRLQSVSCFLSDPVRTKQHRAKSLPIYAWINTLKTSIEEVCEALLITGLRQAEKITDLHEGTFCRDPLCSDTLVFASDLNGPLKHSSITTSHILNIQDRSVCLAVSVLSPLLFDKGDVLVVGSFSAVTLIHVAMAASVRSGRVLVCGADHTPAQVEEMKDLLKEEDIRNVRIHSHAFYSLSEWDSSVQRLKVILVLPRCSCSALSDPVPTIYREHGDWDLLPDLCHGSLSRSKLHSLSNQQARLLGHAVSFPKVQTVVYCTRSVCSEENEQLVKRVLEKMHTPPKLLPFRVNGPIFPDEPSSGDTLDSKFFILRASQFTNGCFIARLSRQADPTKVESVQDVLARAAAKGLLGGVMPDQSKTGKKGKRKKNWAASGEHSSSSSEERHSGDELMSRRDSVSPHEGLKDSGKEEEKGAEGDVETKKKEPKGRKKAAKLRLKHNKKSNGTTKHQKKKPAKKKANGSPNKKHVTGTKPRRIPRLTLTLISSADSTKRYSPIVALAHKLSVSTASTQSQHPSASPHSASTKPKPPPHKTHSNGPKSVRKVAAQQKRNVVTPPKKLEVPQGVETLLLPISSSSSNLLHNKSGSSLSHTSNMSASSSTVLLPGS
ncbi:putative methyltransferase NSUN7 [Gouania willdenowi]|uniref:putative methyltransferase NSUN7 n=1 Tax=Gouania willdenowi TaxID=441366 RepID=UPI001055DB99|nr:putative methyltransferase NSUN7 [Gouania willdenowi]